MLKKKNAFWLKQFTQHKNLQQNKQTNKQKKKKKKKKPNPPAFNFEMKDDRSSNDLDLLRTQTISLATLSDGGCVEGFSP